MPKRVGFLYDRMEERELIRRSIRIGTKDSKKKKRRDVREVLDDIDGHIEIMQEIVRTRSFHPRTPRKKVIYDPSSEKFRETYHVPFFPDGLMQIMEAEAMKDVIMRGMNHWSCAAIPGRGSKRIHKRISSALRNDPKGTTYGGEADVEGYYMHIPVANGMAAFERKIKDQEFLLLLAITVTCTDISLAEALEQNLNWRDIVGDRIGILIGLDINQWFANFYLESLDRYITTLPGVKYMTRHMDNYTLLGPNKKKLHKAMALIAEFMRRNLGLTMKGNWQVYRTTFTPAVAKKHRLLDEKKKRQRKPRMVSAVGFRFSHTHTIMRKRNFLRFTRQCSRVKKKMDAGKDISFQQAAGLLSRIGQLKHCNSHKIRVKYVDPIGVKNLKEVVRHESKRRRAAQRLVHAGGAA